MNFEPDATLEINMDAMGGLGATKAISSCWAMDVVAWGFSPWLLISGRTGKTLLY